MNNDNRLYKFVPVNLLPLIVATIIILGSLYFEVAGGYAPMNPVIFFVIPLLFTIVFMTVETPKTILMAVGMWFPTLRSKIVAGITGVLGIFIGWGLVTLSKVSPSILPIATYPFALSSFASASLPSLLSLSPEVSFFLFFFVAVGEEFMVILLGKNLANYLFSKGMKNTILACVIGFLGARILWASWHFFSYGQLTQPALYLSAIMIGSIFTILAILAGMISKGFISGKDISSMRVIPILLPIAVTAHWAFNWFLSRLMVIPSNFFLILIP